MLRALWETGRCDFRGEFFELSDAEIKPQPTSPIPLVCAGQSDRGIRFTAEHGDRNFVIAGGNTHDLDADVHAMSGITSRLQELAQPLGRDVGTIGLFNIIAAESDREAQRRFDHIVAGADEAAIANLVGHAELDQSEGMSESLKRKSMFMGLPTLVGGWETVARYLDRLHGEAKLDACMFAFPDFERDIDDFGAYIQPRMEARQAGAA